MCSDKGAVAAVSTSAGSERNILPQDPSPDHYELSILPDLKAFTFSATVTISLTAEKPCKTITFNAVDLKLKSCSVTPAGGKAADAEKLDESSFTYDERNGRASIALKKEIVGSFSLFIEYTGVINNKMCGFYRSSYKGADGSDKVMGVTQFEAVDARRALPCWDEPARKATFQVTLAAAKGLTVLNNSPVASTRDATPAEAAAVAASAEEGATVHTFAKTLKMSTYLLAWAIGDFEKVEQTIKKTNSGEETLVRCFCVRSDATGEKREKLRFALDVACRVLPLQEKFFGSDFQMPKLDLIAVPDFAAGAMENWGLVTYRESVLLCDPKTSAAKAKEWTALVVAHELIHSWFGNECTMSWWSGLWLNESNTTWTEFLLTDELFPEWDCITSMVLDETERALTLDSLESSHPVEVPITNAEEVDEVFDVISYCKGCACMRMMSSYLGDHFAPGKGPWRDAGTAALSRGMIQYVKKFSFRNADTRDLLETLGEATGHPELPELMSAWIYKQGFPYLTVKGVDRATGKAQVQQRRFLAGKLAAVADEKDLEPTLWTIPVKVALPNGKSTMTVVKDRNFEIDVKGDNATTSWFKLNANQMCPARVLYEPAQLEALKPAVANRELTSAIDRFSLLTDLHAFCTHGLVSVGVALDFAESYINEDDAAVWSAVATLDADVRAKLLPGQSQEVKDKYDQFARKLFGPIVARVGLKPNPEKDNHRTSQLRTAVFGRAAAAKEPSAVAAALNYFDEAIAAGAATDTNKNTIPSDLRGLCYATAIRERGAAVMALLKKMHLAAQGVDAVEVGRLVRTLGAGNTQALCQEAVEYVMSEAVKAQDAFVALVVVAGNEHGQAAFEKLLLGRWAEIYKKFPGMIMTRVVKAVENSMDLTLGERLLKLVDGLPEQERGSVLRSAQQGAEGQKVLAAWRERDGASLKKFVEKF